MTSVALHRAPEWRAVMWEQLRATGRVSRNTLALLVVATLVAEAVKFAALIRSPVVYGWPRSALSFGYGQFASPVPAMFLGILLPGIVWASDEWANRSYHWSMPVPRGTHTFAKVGAGWLWLMVAVAAYMLMVAIGVAIVRFAEPDLRYLSVAMWQLVVPFVAATVPYMFVSAAIIGSRYPARWLLGIPGAYALIAVSVFDSDITHPHIRNMVQGLVGGDLGVGAAMFAENGMPGALRRWFTASVVWIGIAAFALLSSARRYGDAK